MQGNKGGQPRLNVTVIKFKHFEHLLLLFQTTMTQSPISTHETVLISILLGDHDANQRIETLRHSHLIRDQKYIKQHPVERIRDISDKLNRLERTLLKKAHLDKGAQFAGPTSRKHDELNALNDRLRKVLNKLDRNSRAGVDVQAMERKVVGLYNESVQVLNTQCKLGRELAHLKEQNQVVAGEIEETKSAIQKGNLELASLESLKEINLGRLQRLSNCAFLKH